MHRAGTARMHAERILSYAVAFGLLGLCLLSVVGASAGDCTRQHEGSLVVQGTEAVAVSAEIFCLGGDITVKDDAQLVVTGSTLRFSSPTADIYGVSSDIYVQGRGRLTIEDTTAVAAGWVHIYALESARVSIDGLRSGSGSGLYLSCTESSTVEVRNSDLSIVDVSDSTRVSVLDSTLGEIGLMLRKGSLNVELAGLGPMYFGNWSVPTTWGATFALTVERTQVQGWWIDVADGAAITLRDSTVHGISVTFNGASGTLAGLRPGTFSSWGLRADNLGYFDVDVKLLGTTVGAWNVILNGASSNIGFNNCSLGEMNVYDTSAQIALSETAIPGLRLVNSTGRLVSSGGVLLGPLKAENARFVFEGDLAWLPDASVVEWKDSVIERTYDVRVSTHDHAAAAGISVSMQGAGDPPATKTTSAEGLAQFFLRFTDANYQGIWELRTDTSMAISPQSLSLLTATPVTLVGLP